MAATWLRRANALNRRRRLERPIDSAFLVDSNCPGLPDPWIQRPAPWQRGAAVVNSRRVGQARQWPRLRGPTSPAAPSEAVSWRSGGAYDDDQSRKQRLSGRIDYVGETMQVGGGKAVQAPPPRCLVLASNDVALET